MKTITITRVSSGSEVDFVMVGIAADNLDVRVKLTLEEYALLITGRVIVDCPIEVNREDSEELAIKTSESYWVQLATILGVPYEKMGHADMIEEVKRLYEIEKGNLISELKEDSE